MRRSLISLLVAVPLAVAGSQAAHALDYRIVAPDAEKRAELLAETGHGYLSYLPLAMAVCAVALLAAVVAEAQRTRRGRSRASAAWQYALVAPAVFVVQEQSERLLHDGAVAWGAVLEPSFVVGLAIQLPFALVAFALARVLLRVAQAIGRALGGLPRRRVAPAPGSRIGRSVDVPRLAVPALGFGMRGPPHLLRT